MNFPAEQHDLGDVDIVNLDTACVGAWAGAGGGT